MVANNLKQQELELGQRGTSLWSFKRLKEGLITGLFDDLQKLEKDGLEESECILIKQLLAEIVAKFAQNSTSNRSSLFLDDIWQLFNAIRDEYIAWNDECETPKERRERLKKMREIRNKIANKTRLAYQEIDDNVNKPYIEMIFAQAHRTITTIHKVKFPNLTNAVNYFQNTNTRYSLSGS